MKITYDGRSLLSPWTGIQYYLVEVIKEINKNHPDVEISLFLGSPINVNKNNLQKINELKISKLYYKPLIQSVREKIINKGRRNLIYTLAGILLYPIKPLINKFLNFKTDIFHETDVLPIITNNKSIITVHDIIPRMFPEMFPANTCDQFVDLLKCNLEKVTHIIVDSNNTKDTLSFFFNVAPEKISVVYAGVSKKYKPVKDKKTLESIKLKYNLPDNFILYLGTIEPRKNLSRTLEAFSKASKNIGDTKLVICGQYGWNSDDVYATYERLNLKDKVLFTGYIDDIDKSAIYSSAKAFVFPSLYEGFGLPPLEAMACGTPVISSNTSSLPEIVGDAAILVDPLEIDQIADGMTRLINESELSENLSQKGLIQASKFSWENTASQLVDIYRKVIN